MTIDVLKDDFNDASAIIIQWVIGSERTYETENLRNCSGTVNNEIIVIYI